MDKKKLIKLDSNEDEIIIFNNKLLISKSINLKNPSDVQFEEVWSSILEWISSFEDGENFNVNEIEISDFETKEDLSPPMHRELLLAFKNMFEAELKNILSKMEELKEK